MTYTTEYKDHSYEFEYNKGLYKVQVDKDNEYHDCIDLDCTIDTKDNLQSICDQYLVNEG